MIKSTFEYTKARTKKGPRHLMVDLYSPPGDGPFDLLVWLHSGGFRNGSRRHMSHGRLAAGFTRNGYACAVIDYRLARPHAKLSDNVRSQFESLVAEAVASGEEMPDIFYGARPLAVVEDCCIFLRRCETWKKDLKLSGQYLVGGSSAGAISALNTLYLPQRMNLKRPKIDTVLSFSGGFAYTPSLYRSEAKIYAIHNPEDGRVPISSIRRLYDTTPDPVTLIESDGNVHGHLTLSPEEALAEAVDRCVAFDRDLPIDAPMGEMMSRASLPVAPKPVELEVSSLSGE